ncbi:MAG TPA: AraC family transcriptional regulator, partial [Mycobacterium sp.]
MARRGPDPGPRAATRGGHLIVELSDDSRFGLYAADGATRLDVGSTFLSGPHATSYVSDITPGSTVLAV